VAERESVPKRGGRGDVTESKRPKSKGWKMGRKSVVKGRGWEGRQGGGGQGEEEDKLIQFKSMPWALSYPKFLL
jgi:hypothetical protein